MGSSLRLRLALTGIAVALLAVGVTAYVVQRLTVERAEAALDLDLELQLQVRDELAFYGLYNRSWEGVEQEVAFLARTSGERIALATLDGEILADSAELLDGTSAPLPRQSTLIDPEGRYLDFEPLDVTGLAESLAVDCLTDAVGVTQAQTIGDTGDDIVLGDAAVDGEELDLCIDQSLSEVDLLDEIDATVLGDDDLGGLGVDVDADPPPPLQLYLGYGDNRDSLLNAGLSGPFLLAVAAVMAVAIAATVVTADRIARPLRSLTAAARSMSAGDLSTRVDVGGAGEVAVLGSAFNDMAVSLQAEDEARRTLTSDVAHELRSPLANLRGYLEGVQDGVIEADEGTIASLHEETVALQGLVDDLQQLSLAETGRLLLHRSAIDLGDVVDRTVTAHRGSASTAGVTLTAEVPTGLVIDADADRIRQILANLLGNAIRHTGEGGRVAVGVAVDPEHEVVRVAVADTGEGIAPEHLPHVFERFYRADASRNRATGGTGLGLAIAQELARAHGGDLVATSTLGEGSTFTLVLPAP
ncbi:MAG: ATP-binding protein [Actinomycetota bacterium]